MFYSRNSLCFTWLCSRVDYQKNLVTRNYLEFVNYNNFLVFLILFFLLH